MMALAFRILGDAQEAEDVVQEAFLEAWKRGHEFRRERGSEHAWLSAIARNRALDRLRSRERQGRALSRAALEPFESPAIREDAQERELLARALDALPLRHRLVIDLFYFSGFTHREIALRTGTPLGTVKTRIRYAIERLGTLLAEAREQR